MRSISTCPSMQHARAIGLSLFLALFFNTAASSALAIGASPPTIEASSVLRGGAPQEQSIRISRGVNDVGDLNIVVSVRGDYASYIKFEPSFIIPAEKEAIEYTFQIDPQSASSGSYQVPITFSLIPAPVVGEEGGALVAILAGVTAMINFTVTGEQVIGYSFLSLGANDTEVDDGVFLTFSIANTGNVDWKPSRIDLVFTDKNNPESVITSSVNMEDVRLIGPGKTSQQMVYVSQNLSEGSYIVTGLFFDAEGKQVGELTSQAFSVLPSGALLQEAELTSVSLAKESFSPEEKIPLKAVVKNIGQVPFEVVFMTEIYRDGEYIDLIRGEEMFLVVGEELEFSHILNALEAGEYTLTSYAKFSNRKTDSFEMEIKVLNGGVLGFFNTPLGIALFSAAILLVVAGFVTWRRKKSKAISQVPTPLNIQEVPVQKNKSIQGNSSSIPSQELPESKQ